MEFTRGQLKRKKEVSDFLQVEKQVELSEQAVAASEQSIGDIALGERFREDSAQLGKKKVWKPGEEEKQRNQKIDASMKLTSRATAYTKDLYDVMEARKEQRKITQLYPSVEENLALLNSVRFSRKMLTSSNIRSHFSEYMTMVEAYQYLQRQVEREKKHHAQDHDDLTDQLKKAVAAEMTLEDPQERQKQKEEIARLDEALKEMESWKSTLSERLSPLSGHMNILTERMTAFLSQNRLHMDGSVMAEDEEAAEFEYTEEKARVFDTDVQTVEKGNTYFDPETVKAAAQKVDMQKVTTDLYSEDTVSEKQYEPEVLLFFKDWDCVQRMENIGQLRVYVNLLKERARSIPKDIKEAKEWFEFWKDNPRMHESMKEQIAKMDEELAEVRRGIIEALACLRVAESEAAYMLATSEKDLAKYKAKAEEAYADYRRILSRNAKMRMPLTAIPSVQTKQTLTREQAIHTESDQRNYAFKRDLMEAASQIRDPKFAEFKQSVMDYASVTHYSVTPEEETRRLKDILKERKNWGDSVSEAVHTIDRILEKLNPTPEDIPSWDLIPAELKVDALQDMPKGKTVADLTDEELKKIDRIPKETTAGKQKGSYRNAALTSSLTRTWERIPADEPLFAHEPTVNDLRQGKVSNCYMLAATTGLINYDPQLIKDCIRDNGDGSVTVRLYKPSRYEELSRVPVFVRVPKRVPKLVTGGEILSSGALWMQLIERACAQVGMFRENRSGYQSLWYGKGDEWLEILTGAPRKTIYDKGEYQAEDCQSDDTLFEQISSAQESHKIFHAGTNDDAADGMNSGHAYTVLGTRIIDGKRYVTLRNPYANMSRVENADGTVTKSTSFTSSEADQTAGQFNIPFEEFMGTMKSITVTDMEEAFKAEQKLVTHEVVTKNSVTTRKFHDRWKLSLEEIAHIVTTSRDTVDALADEMDDDPFAEEEIETQKSKTATGADKIDEAEGEGLDE
ncbi:MAG: hypothetical protein K6A92_11930 [Lachnospiraceae bacterium]|nr:hypothetical protein [Lachnospiraceae bacterium]